MKTRLIHIISILSVLIITILNSCNPKSIDAVSKNASFLVTSDDLTIFKDYNLFTFRTTHRITLDTFVIYPKQFTVKLPKKLLRYSISGMSDFVFYYKNDQVIYLQVELYKTLPDKQRIYTPNRDSLHYEAPDFPVPGEGKHDVRKIKPNKDSVDRIIDKGNFRIILYNIRDENIDKFVELSNQLTVIK